MKPEEIKTITLFTKKFNYSLAFDTKYLQDMDVDTYIDYAERMIYVNYSKMFLTRDKDITFPTSLWQEFKEKYFPRWLQKLFPVTYRTKYVKRSVTEIFPDIQPPQHGTSLSIRFYTPNYETGPYTPSYKDH